MSETILCPNLQYGIPGAVLACSRAAGHEGECEFRRMPQPGDLPAPGSKADFLKPGSYTPSAALGAVNHAVGYLDGLDLPAAEKYAKELRAAFHLEEKP